MSRPSGRPRVRVADVARVRFVHSALSEFCGSVQALNGATLPRTHAGWVAGRRRQLRRLDTAALAAIVPAIDRDVTAVLSDGQSLAAPMEHYVARVRAWSGDQLRAVVRRAWLGRIPAATAQVLADGGAERVADAMDQYWATMVAPSWCRMRAVIGAEIERRERAIEEHGFGVALTDLGLEVDPTTVEDGGTLVLLPSIFRAAPLTVSATGEELRLAYVAPGAGAVWRGDRPPSGAWSHGGLRDLLGPQRAALLRALDRPATRPQLARELRTRVAAIADDLSLLVQAGLVDTTRLARGTVYRRSALGMSLLAGRD